MPVDWQAGFLRQARADFEVVRLLQGQQPPLAVCHLLHYLQMTLEKLSKGMMAAPGLNSPPARSHKGAARLLQVLAKSTNPQAKGFHARLGLGDAQRRALINGLLPTAEALERLAPALAGEGPNLEYPWLAPHSNSVSTPVGHEFLEGALSRQKVIKLIELLRVLLNEDL
jgi:hypothetical protein